jgi:hypothetical protein
MEIIFTEHKDNFLQKIDDWIKCFASCAIPLGSVHYMEEIQFTNETYEGRIDKKDQEQCRVVEV